MRLRFVIRASLVIAPALAGACSDSNFAGSNSQVAPAAKAQQNDNGGKSGDGSNGGSGGNGGFGSNGSGSSGATGTGTGNSVDGGNSGTLGTTSVGSAKGTGTGTGTNSSTATGLDITLDNGAFTCTPGQQGVVGLLYQLPVNTPALPDFSTMTPIGQLTAPNLNVPDRDFTEGFPGVPNLTTWFAIDFYAALNVQQAGQYTFETISDDGSKLYVDGQLVVNNDGVHSATTVVGNPINLTVGQHVLHVPWYQGPPVAIALQVMWETPGSSTFVPVPATVLTHATACNVQNMGTFQ